MDLTLPYTAVKNVFENTNFKLVNRSTFVTIDEKEVIVRNLSEFRHAYMNLFCTLEGKNKKQVCFVDKWIKDPLIRTYKCIEFLPPPMICPTGVFNTWRGFAIDKIDTRSSGNVKPFLDHISILVNHDHKSQVYLTNFLAHLVQFPGATPGVCVIFKSKQGCGKSLFLELFSKIIGEEYYHESYNVEPNIMGKLLINVDMMGSKCIDKIKTTMTSSHISFEPKGMGQFIISNFSRFIGTTNNELPFKTRFAVFECSSEKMNDRRYFGEFIEYMTNPSNQKAIIEYLRQIDDLERFVWI